MKNQLEIITNTSQSLSDLTERLQEGLNDAKKNLTDIKNDCSSVRGVNDTFDNINLDDLSTGANFTNLPNVST